MIPTIKTEKSEQTSLLSKHSKDKEDKGDFAELFGLLTQTPKTELPNSKISKVTNKKEATTQNVMLQESNLKNTDKKLLKTTQIPNPKNPKELLEFTKAQNIQSSVKTLKDITQIANKLQLNLQKISIIKDETNKEVSIKNIINPQEVQISQKSTKTLPILKSSNPFPFASSALPSFFPKPATVVVILPFFSVAYFFAPSVINLSEMPSYSHVPQV